MVQAIRSTRTPTHVLVLVAEGDRLGIKQQAVVQILPALIMLATWFVQVTSVIVHQDFFMTSILTPVNQMNGMSPLAVLKTQTV